ncbi:MAG TPA: hypothetical protein VKQ54_16980 [Caulobacteraceae bacterium]|nr:hypothetical protein [Caulobacteraceae bacterium]
MDTLEQSTSKQTQGEQPADQGLTTADLAREAAPRRDEGAGLRAEDQSVSLFPAEDAKNFQSRWDAVQVSFVDEPRRAVEQADTLVAEALKRQAEIFAAARADLEAQWSKGQDVSTEDLRQALQRYRTFFTRVLKV